MQGCGEHPGNDGPAAERTGLPAMHPEGRRHRVEGYLLDVCCSDDCRHWKADCVHAAFPTPHQRQRVSTTSQATEQARP